MKQSNKNDFEWHSLLKDPMDLPDDDRWVECRTTDDWSACFGRYIRKSKKERPVEKWGNNLGFPIEVIAWREVEPFQA